MCIAFLIVMNLVSANHYAPVIALSFAVIGTFIISFFYIIKRLRSFSSEIGESLSKKEIFGTSLPMMVTAFSFLLMGKIDTVMLG